MPLKIIIFDRELQLIAKEKLCIGSRPGDSDDQTEIHSVSYSNISGKILLI